MNVTTIKIKSIGRLIAHQIVPKTKNVDAYSQNSENLLVLNADEKNILIERLHTAICNSTKTFLLAFEDDGTNSVYHSLHNNYPQNDQQFVSLSTALSERLAESHFRAKIPGGYCLIGEGLTESDKTFFFIIKAELQEVFNIERNQLKLIKDVFLSPAKDFYKVGFFIKTGNKFMPFMYDDQFTMQKHDLTEYFYSRFLGLTTDKNDSLRSKNFYFDTKTFIEMEIDNLQDRIGLFQSLRVLFRENTSGTISLMDFANNNLEGELKTKYLQKFGSKYPQSFTRKIDLIEKRLDLHRVSIPLSYTVKIVGDQNSMNDVHIFEGNTISDLIIPSIDSGRVDKVVVLMSNRDGES